MGQDPAQGWVQNLCFSCSFLCRGIAVDSQSRMATFELTSEATVRFTSDLADFFLVRAGCKEEKQDWCLAWRKFF